MPETKEPAPCVNRETGGSEKREASGERVGSYQNPQSVSMTAAEFYADQERLRVALPPRKKPKKQPPLIPVYPAGRTVHIFDGRGALIVPETAFNPNPAGKGGGKRGAIKGWSLASRRRMRELLVTTSCPDGWNCFGVSYTIPGPIATDEEQRAMYKNFARGIEKRGWLLVWRLEIQTREAWHWHGLLSMPGTECGGDRSLQEVEGMKAWWKALDTMSEVTHTTTSKKGKIYTQGPCKRTALDGAFAHSAQVVSSSNQKATWFRYISDHATKAKQEQIPENVGRHWGVIGRKHLRSLLPQSESLTEKQSYDYLRARQRLGAGRDKVKGVPFGTRLQKRSLWGSSGRTVRFGNVATEKRLIEWTRRENPATVADLVTPDSNPEEC